MLACFLIWGPLQARVPATERTIVEPAQITTEPMRVPPPTPLTIDVAGFTKRCVDCHQLFRPNRDQPLVLTQHRDIVQGHGMNDRCFNCHDEVQPWWLVLPGGERLGLEQTSRLCATCHGTAFRDWQYGMHGRSGGSWRHESSDHRQLTCTQCHDPHAPAFAPMHALPGPNTLRMIPPSMQPKPEHGERLNPLRQWSGGAGEAKH